MRWTRIVTVWALLLCLMVINGMFRELMLVRMLGRTVADKVSPILGLMIVLGTTRPFLAFIPPARMNDLWRIGGSWVGLTVVFEFAFGRLVGGKSWAELTSAYAFWNGELWPLVLLGLIIAPFVWAPRRTRVQGPGGPIGLSGIR